MPASRGNRQLVIGLRSMPARDNAYTVRNREILGRLGEVRDAPRARKLAGIFLSRLLRPGPLAIYDVLIVGWAENALVQWGRRLTARGRLEFRAYLWLCRRLSRALITVRHNEVPHATPESDRDRVKALVVAAADRAQAIVVHCPVRAEAEGWHYVPHPLYAIAPGPAPDRNEYVVFGRIERYKAIDRVITAWPATADLAIVGPCSDTAYLDELRALAAGKPVAFEVGFRREAEVAARIAAAAGVVIANRPGSAIVSGTFFFALSAGARVFALETPFYRWVATTGLRDALRVYSSIPALVEGIAGAKDEPRPDPAAVRGAAEALFGDDAVAAGWQAVFDAMPAAGGRDAGR